VAAATRSIFSSALMRLCACFALVALALEAVDERLQVLDGALLLLVGRLLHGEALGAAVPRSRCSCPYKR
jgi:hypothetical protein